MCRVLSMDMSDAKMLPRVASCFLSALFLLVSSSSLVYTGMASASASEFSVELLAMQRDTPDGGELTGPDSPGDDYYSVKQGDFNPGTSPGLRITYGTEIAGHDYILSAFVVDPMQQKETFGDLDAVGVGYDFETNMRYDDDAHLNPGSDVNSTSNSDDSDWMDAEHKTTLFGAEINRVIPAAVTGLISQNVYIGVRGLYLGERLTTNAYEDLNDLQGTDNEIDRGEIETKNRLLGLQLGIQGDRQLTNKVTFAWDAKVGLYANFAERDRKFSSDDNVLNAFSDDLDKTLFSQTLEINPRIDIRLSKNASLNVGANVLWINGISAAGPHFNTLTDFDDNSIRGHEDALFYSVNAGVSIDF